MFKKKCKYIIKENLFGCVSNYSFVLVDNYISDITIHMSFTNKKNNIISVKWEDIIESFEINGSKITFSKDGLLLMNPNDTDFIKYKLDNIYIQNMQPNFQIDFKVNENYIKINKFYITYKNKKYYII